ncbi:MAG: SDR family oxidoreductase [Anaerolineae bacterium]|nr:SDR family oxidoreductase [Anaerolineae bacterium]
MTSTQESIYSGLISDSFKLDGQVALVAGGYGGIGEALCLGLAQQGATVAIAGRSAEKSAALAGQLEASGFTAMGLSFDIKQPDQISSMVKQTVGESGRLDILVNCVGTHIEKPAEALTADDWDEVHDTNLRGAFLLSQAAGRQMIKQERGKQIHISSVRSLLGIRRGFAAYTSSKAGMNLLVKQLATEWAQYGINVNGIAPTFIRTELVRHYLEDEDFYNALVSRIPLTRVGEPFDIVGATVFLASPAADFITGQILFIDGGVTATQ